MGRLLFLISLLISFNLYATCLDELPSTTEELESSIRLESLKYQYSLENQQIFQEIANDAANMNYLSKGVLYSSVTPFLFLVGGGLATYLGRSTVGAVLASRLGLFGTVVVSGTSLLGPPLVSGTLSFGELKKYFQESGFSDEEISELIYEYKKIDPLTCSYAESFEELENEKNRIFEEYLDGSLINHLLDRVRLGGLSAEATLNLYALAKVKTLLHKSKLKELRLLRGTMEKMGTSLQ